MTAHCHKLVAKTAREAAGELYDLLMSNDKMFTEWKRQNPGCSSKQLESRFIEKNWGRCLQIARATLAMLLNGPLEECLKDQIVEALCLDTTLRRGRGPHGELINVN